MADKTYEIEVKTTSDTAGVESVKEILTETKEEVEEVTNATQEWTDVVSEVDSSPIEDFTEKTQEAVETTDEASTSTDNLGVSITSIDPAVIEQLRDSMQEYTTSAQEGAETTNDLMEGLVSGGMATGIGNTFMGLASKAGDYNDSVLRMGLALEGHAMTVDEVNAKYGQSVSKMAEVTGRGAGSVRNHFANMGVAGVNNAQTLEGSFQAIANGSFYSGESIESLSNKFQRISMTGMLSAKQLSGLGLTMEDLAKVMGVSAEDVSKTFKTMTAEQRAEILSTASAQKYGTEVNGVFKNSWEGLWTQLDKGKQGLERLVGELLLPYLIPAVKTAISFVDGLTQTFKSLPAPVKSIIGGFLTFGTAISSLGLGLNAVFKMGKLIFSPFQTLAKLFGVDLFKATKNLALSMVDLGKKTLTAGYNALKSAGMWVVEKTQKLASAVAGGVATVKNWLLAISEWAVASPILIVVGLIIGLIAVLGYLYFNNEQVRQAIDGLGQSLYNIGGIIYGYLQQAWNFLITTLQNVWNYITTLGGLLPANVDITGNQIVDTVLRVLMFIATLPMQLAMIFTNIIAKALGFGDNFAQNMIKGATNMVNGFINKIRELPGMIQTEFSRISNIVSDFITDLPNRVWDLGASIVSALKSALGIGSPGFMYYMMEGELKRIEDAPSKMQYGITKNVGKLGQGITDEFNPTLSMNDAEVMNRSVTLEGKETGDTYIFNFTDTVVDNEDRMEKICDYITKKLTFNNKTAGRTV